MHTLHKAYGDRISLLTNVSSDEITQQLLSTYTFTGGVLLACNDLRASEYEKEAEKILNLVRRHIVGYQIIFSQEHDSYLLLSNKAVAKE